ncbi:MAG: B12-binding domain-containing radical SAM protein [Promethearchaeota archaeon]|nr:MAG: B12-binding domain-containing radical SAM protein [Candidatus Lokiarchaeota archaeon]
MNTILIYPQLEFSKAQIPAPPYSILFIADYLNKRHVNVKIFDLRFDKNLDVLNEISLNELEYIGISVMTGPQIKYALRISELIKKKFNEIKIVWGGMHPTIRPKQTLKHPLIDLVVRGEGEKTYFELVSGRELEKIDGLSFKRGNKIIHNKERILMSDSEINELSIPWELMKPKYYINNQNFNLITSRGCPYQCAFCYNSMAKNRWRGWTVDKCIHEFNKVLNYDVKKITFYDDNFFANPKRISGIFNYLKEHDIIWKAEIRVDRLDLPLAEAAKKAGCRQLFFGAESGSERLLKLIMKNITIQDIIKSAKITKKVGLVADYSWMVGIPGEKQIDRKKTISLIKKIKKINPECEFSIKILYPYPRTLIFQEAVNHGFKPPVNLIEWSNVRREKAPDYLEDKNRLEMISLVSAIVGRKVFEISDIPFLKILKFYADFRWEYEFFDVGIENFLFKISRGIINKFMNRKSSKGYDQFSQKII